jgi:hypothetical protein
MGGHIVKTTIEIAESVLEQAQRVARQEKTTLRALVDQGLRIVLKEKQSRPAKWKWKPLVVRGHGLAPEFRDAGWGGVRDEIYRGRGA